MVFILKSVSCTVGLIWAFVSLSQGVIRDHTEVEVLIRGESEYV